MGAFGRKGGEGSGDRTGRQDRAPFSLARGNRREWKWLGGKESNPHKQIQSLLSYR